MYEFRWTAAANDAVWATIGAALRRDGVPAPERLTRGAPLQATWRDPGLVLGQTCGYPYRHGLVDVVEIVATPRYGFEGCEGPRHCSFLVVRADDPRRELAAFAGARAAINARDSNTGMNLFRACVAPLAANGRLFADVIVTGAHVASVEAVASGRADIAAIDCVTFAQLRRGRPDLIAAVSAIGRTPATPGLPLIAGRGLAPRVREALFAALAEPALADAWAALGVVGADVLAPQDYAAIDALEAAAARLGYRELS